MRNLYLNFKIKVYQLAYDIYFRSMLLYAIFICVDMLFILSAFESWRSFALSSVPILVFTTLVWLQYHELKITFNKSNPKSDVFINSNNQLDEDESLNY